MHLCNTSHSRRQALPGCQRLTPAEGTRFRWLAEGWRPGLPGFIDAATFAIDEEVARHLVCPDCYRAGLSAEAFHRGAKGFRVLHVCPCGFAEEG